MEFLYRYFPETIIEAIGWTLFHALWQGAILTALLVGVLYVLKKSRAQIRYLISFLTLVTLFIWAGLTFNSAYGYAREKQTLKKNLITHPEQVIEVMQGKLQQVDVSVTTRPREIQLRWVRFRAFMQRNFPVIFALWLIGVFFFLFRMAGGVVYMQSLRIRQTLPLDNYWINKIKELKYRLGIMQRIEALQSALVKVPMVLGFVKPVLLLPVSFFTGLGEVELEAVIAHELAHIRRHDYILNIIQSVIETLFFFHPAVWLVSKYIRDEREHCCDDLAIEITGNRVAYVKALAVSQELALTKQSQYALTFTSGKSNLLKRVKRIKNHKIMKNKVPEGFIAASLIFISVVLVSFSIDNGNLKNEYLNSSRFNRVNKLPVSISRTDKTVREKHEYNNVSFDYDSIDLEMQEVMEELEALPEEMEQLMEIACTENDHELALLILESVNLAMSQIDMELIRREIDQAMREVDSVMAEQDMEAITREAMEESRMEMEQEHIDLAEEAIRIAAETIEAIDIHEIVRVAMEETRIALQSIDFEAIQRETQAAMEEAEAAMREAEAAREEKERAMEEMERTREVQEEILRESINAREEEQRSMEEQLEELENY